MGQANEGTIINYIMDKVPKDWGIILNIGQITTLAELKIAVNREEQNLLRGFGQKDEISKLREEMKSIRQAMGNGNRFRPQAHAAEAEEITEEAPEPEAHFASNDPKTARVITPMFPPQNWVKSKGQTPGDKGKGGCRFCSSMNHWDNDCPKKREGVELEKKKKLEKLNTYKAKVHALEAEVEITESLGNDEDSDPKNYLTSDEEQV